MSYNINTSNYRSVSYSHPTKLVSVQRNVKHEKPKEFWDHVKEETKDFGNFLWENKGYILAGAAVVTTLYIIVAAQSQEPANGSLDARTAQHIRQRPQKDEKYLTAKQLNTLSPEEQRKIATAGNLKNKMEPAEREKIAPEVIRNMQNRSVNALKPSVIKTLSKDSQQAVKTRTEQKRDETLKVLDTDTKRLASVNRAIASYRTS